MRNRLLLIGALLAIFAVCNGQAKVVKPQQRIVDDVGSIGAQNAVKKAHQMTDLEFVPQRTLVANKKTTYKAGEKYKGVIYSSVKETSSFVGLDVSFHTFMTAVNNPRSVLYTENVSKAPYHGKNCALYYGTVCSAMVTYALGLDVNQKSYNFPIADFMTLLEDQSAKGIQLADVLWQQGHVAMITGIRRNLDTGEIVWIEISEAWPTGCRRREKNNEKDFNDMLVSGNWKIYRYKDLDKNGYQPLTEFVAVDGEKRTPFQYNESICPNRGDKSCYITGDTVVLNLSEGYNRIEVYKDSELYQKIKIGDNLDVMLTDLPYGDYKARLRRGRRRSDFAYWKVVDVNVKADTENQTVSFQSKNATPVYYEFCTVDGDRPDWADYLLSKKDIANGFVKIDASQQKNVNKYRTDLYVKVHFECDYGRVINKPILWRRKNSTAKTTPK